MYIKIFAAACKMHISPRPQRTVKTAALKARQRHITASLIFCMKKAPRRLAWCSTIFKLIIL